MYRTTKLAALLAASMALSGLALADNGRDAEIQARLAVRLAQKSEFKDIRPSVTDGIVTLQGTVDSYKHKLDAENKARKQDHVAGVRDLVTVAGPEVSDVALRDKLARKLAYDRVGFGNVFDLLTVGVDHGVATIAGEVHDPMAHGSAISAVVNTPGVKGVVDNIKVAPTSFYDDALRIRLARAIYRDPSLWRYGMDPQAPIRIVVDNGHVGLYGLVDNDSDRTLAFLRASGVAGAFSVENHLETSKSVNR
jgi:osmotically-inducible protein OsmY